MKKIEDYALIGDCRTAALIDLTGSMDWLCLPSFDSPACLASLIGEEDNGRWFIRPSEEFTVTQTYRKDTLILETRFQTDKAEVLLTDFMSVAENENEIFRMVEVIHGETEIVSEFNPRFEYGSRMPMIMKRNGSYFITKGPLELVLHSDTELKVEDAALKSHTKMQKGDKISFQLFSTSSFRTSPPEKDIAVELQRTVKFWKDWIKSCHLDDNSEHPEIIKTSVLILKALTSRDYGSITAAVTTSVPEEFGGCRNWDYRFCWPRDAALAMRAVLNSTGQQEEIKAWRHWLIRATAGLPEQMEVLYCLNGMGALNETNLTWLSGLANSRPVRIGNQAREQVQLDIFASTIEVFYLAEKMGFPPFPECWDLARAILEYLEKIWRDPDAGIWEVRGPPRQFVHSKLMVWVAFDLCIQAHDELGIKGPVEHWKKIREEIREEICQKGYNENVKSFTQYYGSEEVDASLLRMAIFDFLPVDDERMQGTIRKIEQDLLLENGLIMRYRPSPDVEGLPESGVRAFIICSAWLGEVYALQGDLGKAEKVLEKLISITNHVGLLSEQYDPREKRQTGNFPQAFSHIALIHLELVLSRTKKIKN